MREAANSLYNYEDYVFDSKLFPGVYRQPNYRQIIIPAHTEESKATKMLRTFEQAVIEIQNDLLEKLPKFLRF